MVPLQGERFLPPIMQPVPIKAFQQPARAAAMCTALRAETCPPPSISLFLLVKNLTDNMWPPKSMTKGIIGG